MSQWTQVLGVIRYDTHTISNDFRSVLSLWRQNLPEGSEGPLYVDPVDYALHITGDLRDFGKENIVEILNWANSAKKLVQEQCRKHDMYLRDAFIWCSVGQEDCGYLLLGDITDKADEPFALIEVKLKESPPLLKDI